MHTGRCTLVKQSATSKIELDDVVQREVFSQQLVVNSDGLLLIHRGKRRQHRSVVVLEATADVQ